jgi:hypothetical protein
MRFHGINARAHQSRILWMSLATIVLVGLSANPALARRKRRTPPPAGDTSTSPGAETPAPATTPPTVVVTPAAPATPAPEPEKEVAKPAPPPATVEPPAAMTAAHPAGPEATATATAQATPAAADSFQRRISGHVGVGTPIATFHTSKAVQRVTSFGDDFTLVAPFGLGFHVSPALTFDFEVQVATGVKPEGLTTAVIDPGVLYSLGRVTPGFRLAWQLNVNQNIGFVPLVDVTLVRAQAATWFVEASVPAFIQNKNLTVAGSFQTGVSF